MRGAMSARALMTEALWRNFVYENMILWAVVGVVHAVEFHRRAQEREELRALLDHVRGGRAGGAGVGYVERFAVRSAGRVYFVRAADVDWLDVDGNYVRLHAGGRVHLVRGPLGASGVGAGRRGGDRRPTTRRLAPASTPMPNTRLAIALLAAAALAAPARAQSAADSSAIRATALDYVEGWYAGDGARMERALHPELAKRIVRTDPASGRSRLDQMSAMSLVMGTRAGGGQSTPAAQRQRHVAILDVFGNAASVRATMSGWVDYMHMAKVGGRWVIVNVLWELKPAPSP